MCTMGRPVSSEEEQHLKWLSSPLFSNGFELGYGLSTVITVFIVFLPAF